jgi:hypothetical protein
MLARLGDVYVAGIVEVKSKNRAQRLSRWLPYVGGQRRQRDLDRVLGRRDAIVPARDDLRSRRGDHRSARRGDRSHSRIGDPDDATTSPGLGRVVWTELLANDTDAAAQFYRDVVGYEPSTTRGAAVSTRC